MPQQNKPQKPSVIQKALSEIEAAWEEMKTIRVEMNVEEFEKKLLRQAKRHGTPYSTETDKWLHEAKGVIADPDTPRELKNLYLSECDPPELAPVLQRLYKAFNKLNLFAEWSYKDLVLFLGRKEVDPRLKAFLRWRALPVAEAFHRRYHEIEPQLKNAEQRKRFYLRMRPSIIFSAK